MKLVSVLPYLALAGFAVEPVAAHGSRFQRDRHHQLARNAGGKPVARALAGAQEKPRIMRRTDGSQCRIRPNSNSNGSTGGSNTDGGDSNTTQVPTAPQGGNTDAPQGDNTDAPQGDNTDAPQGDNTDAPNTGAPTDNGAPAPTSNIPQGAPTDAPTDAPTSAGDQTDAPAPTSDAPGTDNIQPTSNGFVADKNFATPTATTDAPQDTSVTVAPPTGGGGGKFGLIYPNGLYWLQNSEANPIGTKTGWFYTWSSKGADIQQFWAGKGWNIEFVPILWGLDRPAEGDAADKYQPDLWHRMESSWPSNTKNGLFFNEPEIPSQSNIDPNGAIQYWMNDYVPVLKKHGMRKGSAAVTDLSKGIPWIQEFETNCKNGNSASDCTADFVVMHFYGNTVQGFQDAVNQMHTTFGRNVWVTEYACHSYANGENRECSDSETWEFHQGVRSWMDSTDYVERYAPFAAIPNGLPDGVGQANNIASLQPEGSVNYMQLSDLGNTYAY